MFQPERNGASIELGPVTLGTGLMARDLRKALRTARIAVSDDADTTLDQVVVGHALREVVPVIISVRDLGYGMTDLGHILAGGIELGLQLCTSEFAPQVCLQHKKALPSERLHIAMNPMLVNALSVIHAVLRIQGKLWLSTAPGMVNANYPAECKFMFSKPKE